MSKRNWFADAFGDVLTDIRQKLVEEPWFGRAVTPPLHKVVHSTTDIWGRETGFDAALRSATANPTPGDSQEPQRDQRQDLGIDR